MFEDAGRTSSSRSPGTPDEIHNANQARIRGLELSTSTGRSTTTFRLGAGLSLYDAEADQGLLRLDRRQRLSRSPAARNGTSTPGWRRGPGSEAPVRTRLPVTQRQGFPRLAATPGTSGAAEWYVQGVVAHEVAQHRRVAPVPRRGHRLRGEGRPAGMDDDGRLRWLPLGEHTVDFIQERDRRARGCRVVSPSARNRYAAPVAWSPSTRTGRKTKPSDCCYSDGDPSAGTSDRGSPHRRYGFLAAGRPSCLAARWSPRTRAPPSWCRAPPTTNSRRHVAQHPAYAESLARAEQDVVDVGGAGVLHQRLGGSCASARGRSPAFVELQRAHPVAQRDHNQPDVAVAPGGIEVAVHADARGCAHHRHAGQARASGLQGPLHACSRAAERRSPCLRSIATISSGAPREVLRVAGAASARSRGSARTSVAPLRGRGCRGGYARRVRSAAPARMAQVEGQLRGRRIASDRPWRQRSIDFPQPARGRSGLSRRGGGGSSVQPAFDAALVGGVVERAFAGGEVVERDRTGRCAGRCARPAPVPGDRPVPPIGTWNCSASRSGRCWWCDRPKSISTMRSPPDFGGRSSRLLGLTSRCNSAGAGPGAWSARAPSAATRSAGRRGLHRAAGQWVSPGTCSITSHGWSSKSPLATKRGTRAREHRHQHAFDRSRRLVAVSL